MSSSQAVRELEEEKELGALLWAHELWLRPLHRGRKLRLGATGKTRPLLS